MRGGQVEDCVEKAHRVEEKNIDIPDESSRNDNFEEMDDTSGVDHYIGVNSHSPSLEGVRIELQFDVQIPNLVLLPFYTRSC